MPYIVTRIYPAPVQVSIFDILANLSDTELKTRNVTKGATMTRFVDHIRPEVLEKFDFQAMIEKLADFNKRYEKLFDVPRKSLYREFYIPKNSGGLRKIDAPNDELMGALRELGSILRDDFGALYHTAAYAYITGRCTIDAVKRHQANESKWFLKTDFSNFFGSTTLQFCMKMLAQIFPFSEVATTEEGYTQLERALSLAFLDGGLPQGTPLSPLLTNIVSIPIDHALAKHFSERHMVYTRYADDMLISSQKNFRFSDEVNFINETVRKYGAPWQIKPSKTRYGSSAGQNWNLGVMLNKDNEITIGHKRKKQFKAMIFNYLTDYKKGIQWDLGDVQEMRGLMSYYLMVERQTIGHIILETNKKTGLNLMQVLKADLGGRHGA